MPFWKFTKGPHKGKVALVVDNEKLKAATTWEKELVTLYVDGTTVAYIREALEQIADHVDDKSDLLSK